LTTMGSLSRSLYRNKI